MPKISVSKLIAELRAGVDDPMWADHCEMPKRVAELAAEMLLRYRTVLGSIDAALAAGHKASEILDENSPIRDSMRGIEMIETGMPSIFHIIPENDLREHEWSEHCWCMPTRDEEEPNAVIHHSMDGREKIENVERLKQ